MISRDLGACGVKKSLGLDLESEQEGDRDGSWEMAEKKVDPTYGKYTEPYRVMHDAGLGFRTVLLVQIVYSFFW